LRSYFISWFNYFVLREFAEVNVFQSLISTQSRLVITSSEGSPSTDSVLSSDAICVEVPTDDIRVGDSVLVLPGETIPIDVSLSDCW